jgi:alpha-glucosidase
MAGLGCLAISAIPARGQWESMGSLQSVTRDSNRVTLNCQNAEMQITALASRLVRVRMTPGHSFAQDQSWAIAKTDWPPIQTEIGESPSSLTIGTSELSVEISRSPCRVTFRDKSGTAINQDDTGKGMSWDGKQIRQWKVMPPDENYSALGEKAWTLEHGNQVFVNWNTDAFGYQRGSDPIYQSIPFILALRGGRSYGIFFDNTYRSSFDFGKMSRGRYSFGAEEGELNYYFLYGPSPKQVVELFTELTGRMPLPPRWALGYQQSRYSYDSEDRVRDIASGFRRRNIPCDAIYLDIDYMDGYRSFTVDTKKFPHFQQMISDLAREGMKVIVIIDPGVKQEPGYWVYDSGLKGSNFIKMPGGEFFSGDVWPGRCVFPDFTRESTRGWWGSLYKGLVEAGVKGFWNDMNEPSVFVDTDIQMDRTVALDAIHDDNGLMTSHRKSHNVYGMLMARATFEGLRTLRPQQRPFVLTRASYAGGQRYAATWTGDNSSTWDHLGLWIPMTLNLGLSGQPFAGPDIGGFVGDPSAELYSRFMEASAFSPFMREHSNKGTRDREPWAYGPAYERINRESIEIRYRLMPYIYTLFEEASRTGLPVMRPLFLEFPADPKTYRLDTEFMFGPDLLVAPVLTEGVTARTVYLPAGDWIDFRTGERISGAKETTVQAPPGRVPLFARAGAIIPARAIRQYENDATADPLILNVFPDPVSTGTLYEDDGLTYAYQKGEFSRTVFRWRQSASEGVLEIEPKPGAYKHVPRHIQVNVMDARSAPRNVQLGDGVLTQVQRPEELGRRNSGWTYDSRKSILSIRFPQSGALQRVVVSSK